MASNEDQMWVVQQMTNNHVIKNYLECEFQNFELNVQGKDGSH